MEVFIQKFITVSNRKILGRNCSELHFTGTNLCFPFLSNSENNMMESKFSVELSEIKNEIDAVKNISKTLLIRNGEPCLQRQALKSIAKYAKDMGMLVGVETYGTKPNVIKQMLERRLVDLVYLKLYCPLNSTWMKKLNKCSLLNDFSSTVDDIKKTIKILQTNKIKVYVNTIVVPSLLYKKNDIDSIVKSVHGINNCTFELIPFQPEDCGKLFMNLNPPGEELMQELKNYVEEKYPKLRVR